MMDIYELNQSFGGEQSEEDIAKRSISELFSRSGRFIEEKYLSPIRANGKRNSTLYFDKDGTIRVKRSGNISKATDIDWVKTHEYLNKHVEPYVSKLTPFDQTM